MVETQRSKLNFINSKGEFILEDANENSYLYFPLANEAGLMSSITPDLNGDIKTGQNTFLLAPVSSEDLRNTKSSRNFWLFVEGYGIWSATGNSAKQQSMLFTDKMEKSTVEAGFLYHKITRTNEEIGLISEIINFIPVNNDKLELMKVNITNVGDKDINITPTAAIPVFARSADNIRDHRHVTSLLHRISVINEGIIVKPTLSFDERGHSVNDISYYVMGMEGNGKKPIGFFPEIEEFAGEGGSLEWPEAVVKNMKPYAYAGNDIEGYEAIGAIRFDTIKLCAKESKSYILIMGINEGTLDAEDLISMYGSEEGFNYELEKNKVYWMDRINNVSFQTSDENFNNWMKWVTLQPILRRIYGCSFLPHHDYGRGGRGWRDLWQDCLALLIMEPRSVRNMLFNNFAGVRIDGSNATIIGSKPGEFIADRNNIARIWMDHGAWPFLTTKLYIDQSGDIDFLLEKQEYFKDKLIYRCSRADMDWNIEDGSKLLETTGSIYKGTILEHLLIQNLTPFFNVGEHNNIRLEGGDWNDGLDMASKKGESVAFTSLYGSNLLELSDLLLKLKEIKSITEVELTKEILLLINIFNNEIDYDSVEAKQILLNKYYDLCKHNISGDFIKINIDDLASDLMQKGQWIINHIRTTELIKDNENYIWFNGYYDNNGSRVEGEFNNKVRMILTSQVFAIMGGVATDNQVAEIVKSATKYLKDEKVSGYRLNTNFNEVKLDMGRLFGFAFGHKENGAMFSHMSVMYGNALYKRGFAKEGFEVINSIFTGCMNFEKSHIYPGIPEYINEKGRGMYSYLTGSASWLLLTILNEAFGIKGDLGNLVVEPKLLVRQFNNLGEAKASTIFGGKRINVIYKNIANLEYGEYEIKSISIDKVLINFKANDKRAVISRSFIDNLSDAIEHELIVELS